MTHPQSDATPDTAPSPGDTSDATVDTDPPTSDAAPDTRGATASGRGTPEPADIPAPAPRGRRRARRGGALSAVGTIVAVAILAAAAPIIWARLSTADPADASETRAPQALADGRPPPALPAAIAAAIGRTTVGTGRLDDPDAVARGCGLDDADVLSAYVTPDHATVLAATDQPPPDVQWMIDPETGQDTVVACVASWAGDGWRNLGAAALPREGPESRHAAWLCCDASSQPIIHRMLPVREGAAWLLQDHGTHAVAYDVAGLQTVGIAFAGTNDGRTATAHVWWVDADGTIVGEDYLGE